jgi:hypothetical protein
VKSSIDPRFCLNRTARSYFSAKVGWGFSVRSPYKSVEGRRATKTQLVRALFDREIGPKSEQIAGRFHQQVLAPRRRWNAVHLLNGSAQGMTINS